MGESGAAAELVPVDRSLDLARLTDLAPTFWPAFAELRKAYDFARQMARSRWEFAVEIGRLRVMRLTESDLRWLICMGLVEHAEEVTQPHDQERRFHPTQSLSFTKRTCFVLTSRGAELASGQTMATLQGVGDGKPHVQSPVPHDALKNGTPIWDRERRELRVADRLVKHFKWSAVNQEMILAAFEEEHWPARIDDPLPPRPGHEPKRRLNDTIKCLNRNQAHRLIHFHGDGTGEGVVWKHADGDGHS